MLRKKPKRAKRERYFNKAPNPAGITSELALALKDSDTDIARMLIKHDEKRRDAFYATTWKKYVWKTKHPRSIDCAYCHRRSFPRVFYMKRVKIWNWDACVNCVEGNL